MMLSNVRQRLTRNDVEFAMSLLAPGSGDAFRRLETVLRDEGVDAILDDPRLATALRNSSRGARASLPLFLYVIVRHALRGVGESDRGLADFVASIVFHFGFASRATRIAEHDDEVYSSLVALASAAESTDPQRSFLARAHLGNYALWLGGLFPDHIERKRWHRGGPSLDYYDEMGSHGYRLAASHRLAATYGVEPLLRLAADRFPAIRAGLNRVSDWALFPHVTTPERLMRLVRTEMLHTPRTEPNES